ncbi:AAA family ATPase [Kribbella catacumbae]|uniref:AAA family ATPase n=1 Tax=Kribbella catacumbae TaxID=460086 RepID=UPI00037211D5|nr:ATP-binding protein [Kribbella catacumbae]
MEHRWPIVVTGLPGTGKSTLADRLAREIAAPAFAGDWLLGAMKPHDALRGLDRPKMLAMYYDLLGTLVARPLMLGQSAIVDCLVSEEIVARWRELAEHHSARLRVVECVCSDELEHRRRLEGRRREIPGWHEVDWAHVERMRAEYPPLSSPDLLLDAIDPIDSNLDKIRHRIPTT